jgi:hypothetical protein
VIGRALTQNSPVHARTKKIDINPSLVKKKKRRKSSLHITQLLLFPFSLVSFFVSIFLNRDLDTALVSGGAAAEAGEEVGDVVLDVLLVMSSDGECRK